MLLPGGSSEIRCVKHPAQYLVLTDVIFLPSFIFRLTLTPFRWGITSAQRIHALQFFIHGCWVGWLFHASLMSWVGVENYGPVCWPQWTQVEGLQFSPPSSWGGGGSHAILGDGCTALFHRRGQCWAPGRFLLVSSPGSSFSNERQADLPLQQGPPASRI